ncbi:putative toxin-antitoxin system toxin component, PIN family [Pseudoduganella violacea]|uniref:Putative PIN family toxin of toxin-antitoxin system n=1 Tax=Pseudoduganella violacea TaxID=1715466 RepID=A0A7W5B5M3_9BURK|nr:putative PIN family toxin of toxin-antitoxin system [Pseudoduganella violacea]
MYRLVLDTNVIISALLWRGTPNQLLTTAASGLDVLYTCQEILSELRTVLQRAKFTSRLRSYGSTPDQLTSYFALLANQVQLTLPIPSITGDPADDMVLACGVAASADFIVTGDTGLLNISCYRGIPVASPRMALKKIEQHP